MSKKSISIGPTKRFKEAEDKLDQWVFSKEESRPDNLDELVSAKKQHPISRTTLSLPSDLLKKIRARSLEEGISMNQYIIRRLMSDLS